MLKVALMWSWSMSLYRHLTITNNGRHILHAWLDKDYRLPGMMHTVDVDKCMMLYIVQVRLMKKY